MTPAQAIKLEKVELNVDHYPKEKDVLSESGLYRYLLQPGEEHGDTKRRATDNNWSKRTFRLREILQSPGQRVLYYLEEDGPQRPFVREELMQIPENTEKPPDYVKEW